MRPSDDTRERTVARLRRGYVAGRLDTDTFSRRVDCALSSGCGDELRGLTADLPAPRSLPLGRAPGCQLVFDDDTVSRRHAELRMTDGRWILRDLGSSNGTWVNGRQVMEAEVVAGDLIRMGGLTIRI